VLDSLATYERSLITPNARFDRYLRGEHQALTAEEQRGYQLFKSYGCVACHQGVNVGGNLFQKFGIFPAMVGQAPPGTEPDPGRFGVTGVARDRWVFRVPSLRNVVLTAPYFHDGRAPTLEDAVDTMARVQLGRTLTGEEIGLIVQFLHTLTGDYEGRSLADAAREGW
jgi:cytochrome c peroxidase